MKLGDFKDKYKGHRAFFIGNGPSINQTPLHLMKDEYCFGTNKVYRLFEFTDWRPTHYIAITGHNCHFRDWAKGMNEAVETGIPCFLADWYWDDETPKWFMPPSGENVIRLPVTRLRAPRGNTCAAWSTDIEDAIYSHRTVSVCFLQLAHWMGFSPLYLVGCDMDYKPFGKFEADPNHWCDDYDNPRTQQEADLENFNMTEAHMSMAEIARNHGVEVYNATIGGSLEAYPRVDIFEVLVVHQGKI